MSKNYQTRYVVVDAETKEVLDDAQGYGYKTAQKAHAAYAYKNRDKTKDIEKEEKRKHIKQWLKEHKNFTKALNDWSFIFLKDQSGDEVDTAFVKKLLKEYKLEIDFTPYELIRVWKKG